MTASGSATRLSGFGWHATRRRTETGAALYVYFLRSATATSTPVPRTIFGVDLHLSNKGRVVSTRKYLPAVLRSYVAVADEATARSLERYFKSGSGKAFANKRFLHKRADDERDIMSSETPDPLANRAFTIWAPLHSMAGAAGLKT